MDKENRKIFKKKYSTMITEICKDQELIGKLLAGIAFQINRNTNSDKFKCEFEFEHPKLTVEVKYRYKVIKHAK